MKLKEVEEEVDHGELDFVEAIIRLWFLLLYALTMFFFCMLLLFRVYVPYFE